MHPGTRLVVTKPVLGFDGQLQQVKGRFDLAGVVGHLAPHHQIRDRQDDIGRVVEKRIFHRHRCTGVVERFGGLPGRIEHPQRGACHGPRIMMHRPGHRPVCRIAVEYRVENRLPAPEPDTDMGDRRQISLQRHHHVRCRRLDQDIAQEVRDHRRTMQCVAHISCLHAGKHEHMRIMTMQCAVEGRSFEIGPMLKV